MDETPVRHWGVLYRAASPHFCEVGTEYTQGWLMCQTRKKLDPGRGCLNQDLQDWGGLFGMEESLVLLGGRMGVIREKASVYEGLRVLGAV